MFWYFIPLLHCTFFSFVASSNYISLSHDQPYFKLVLTGIMREQVHLRFRNISSMRKNVGVASSVSYCVCGGMPF